MSWTSSRRLGLADLLVQASCTNPQSGPLVLSSVLVAFNPFAAVDDPVTGLRVLKPSQVQLGPPEGR